MSNSPARRHLYISGSTGIKGAVVNFSGPVTGSAGVNKHGIYLIMGLTSGTYTITPSLAGYTFTPEFQIVNLNSVSLPGIVFIPVQS